MEKNKGRFGMEEKGKVSIEFLGWRRNQKGKGKNYKNGGVGDGLDIGNVW